MSDPDTGNTSYETTSNNRDGGSSPVYPTSAGRSPQPEEAEGRSADRHDPAEDLTKHHRQDDAAEERREASARKTSSTKPQSGMKFPTYRHVLNAMIDETAGRMSNHGYSIGPSQIEASHWTAAEKDALFRKLTICGPGDLHSLSAAVGSKSEAEINVYLKLLQDGIAEARATVPSELNASATDAPSAYEVSPFCEAGLESAADSLSGRLAKSDAQAEQDRYGDYWLIDATLADEIEQDLESSEIPAGAGDGQDAEVARPDLGTRSADSAPFESASLLRPTTFLQLSYNIYMAGTPGDDSRWYASGENVDDPDEPAMFRSAFEDFYNVAVSITRRLVQATIFQTMTRLRASDGSRMAWTPEPLVREKDVKTAIDILGMNGHAWSTYWARLPRRQGLIVYSDSKKYRDGRPGTKNGVGLSYEEVEAELGLPTDVQPEDEAEELDDVSPDEMDFDSDDFTVISVPGSEPEAENNEEVREIDANVADATEQSHDDKAEKEAESASHEVLTLRERQWATRKLKRKRALSPIGFGRAQDAWLDATDMNASREEERRLWQSIRKHPPDHVQLDRQSVPASPVLNGVVPAQTTDWRDRVEYEAPWERFGAPIADAEFAAMELSGRQGRKRRRIFRDRWMEAGGLGSDDDGEQAGKVADAEERLSADHESVTAGEEGLEEVSDIATSDGDDSDDF
ncbi:RNA polymerase I-specific transcription initiation factor rrn5 [Teratosphaeria destructans]|uniref:RNA polymerase I-specific transcription initiation factor rrn5 n=1 Tax=Teratosphaeria destructans TaxID=418781 RepID=A0A9W7SIY4_9PEZI|nr:RNA polymerase I-specific transcription initiation factor rrn5 [Teratosphaeria destructans]